MPTKKTMPGTALIQVNVPLAIKSKMAAQKVLERSDYSAIVTDALEKYYQSRKKE